jgi:hypothetical protein
MIIIIIVITILILLLLPSSSHRLPLAGHRLALDRPPRRGPKRRDPLWASGYPKLIHVIIMIVATNIIIIIIISVRPTGFLLPGTGSRLIAPPAGAKAQRPSLASGYPNLSM